MIRQVHVQIIGAAVGVASVIVTNFVSLAIDRQRQVVEADLARAEHKIEWSNQQFVSAEERAHFAELLLVVVQSTNPPAKTAQRNIEKVTTAIVSSITGRYSAVTGDLPSQDKMSEWSQLATSAEQGNAAAWNALSSSSQELLPKYVTEQNRRVANRDELRLRKSDIESIGTKVQAIGGGIAILAVFVVLLKDLLPKDKKLPAGVASSQDAVADSHLV
jgi:hypothetical protein